MESCLQSKPTGAQWNRFVFWLCLGLAWLGFSSLAEAKWWDGQWSIRKKITVDLSPQATGIKDSGGGAVLLIRLHDGNFQFSAAKEDGSDIRFIAADNKTPLTFHLERYDPLLAEAFAWVKLPDLKANAENSFWLYYGNSGNKATRADDPKGTYDADTVLVYHFAERNQPPTDSSSGGNNAQNAGTPVDGSLIGGGIRLDGHSLITIPASPSLTWPAGASFTWSAWVKAAALAPNSILFSRSDGANSFLVGLNNGVPFVSVNGNTSTPGSPIPANEWHQLAVTAAGTVIQLLVDGEVSGSLAAAMPALSGPAFMGGESTSGGGGFVGEVDELEIAKTQRSPAAIKLSAINQGSGDKASKLLTFAPDEQTGSWLTSGYIGIILKSLTADGWVVIGLLMIMAAISWLVMINKASYLNAIKKGNELFLKEWRHVAADLTVLDHADAESMKTFGGRIDEEGQRAMHKAPLFRIYHIGSGELQSRLTADREGRSKGLSARSIQAIRATLDGGLVRETQKLNSLMVLLTIAISGGPFLGLLGTVIGVMITFAAIAAQGDVNVNAIAPGIAAALAATVAGLAVAIPSLFGYNYLLSRVKNTTSDMHVFIDEFVTRMAEFYETE
jgi:biopolymer transport protein ExbB